MFVVIAFEIETNTLEQSSEYRLLQAQQMTINQVLLGKRKAIAVSEVHPKRSCTEKVTEGLSLLREGLQSSPANDRQRRLLSQVIQATEEWQRMKQ